MTATAVLAVVPAVLGFVWLNHMHRRHGAGPLIWRWFTGQPLDGEYRTNAGWTRRGDKVLHRSGRAHWFWHQARIARAAIRSGGTVGAFGLTWALLFHRAVTIQAALAAAALFVAFLGWQVYRFRPVHHFRRVRPTKRAVTSELGVPPTKFKVARDLSETVVGLPAERVLNEPEQASLLYVVEQRLRISVEPAWHQEGGALYAKFRKVVPPPELTEWAAFEEAVAGCRPDELVVGMGKDGKVIKVSLTHDSPHFGISMGSGAGKSNLATFWLVQELMRGAIVLVLDAKWMSHPWVFKDMDAEYGQLPCARYNRATADLHNAMVWLGEEVKRRSQVADRIVDAKGDMHASRGTVGPRLWVVAEEMNLAADRLKEYWASIREKGQPARSPAFTGFGACSQAGRALKMHMIVIAQQLTANAVGGGAVRENLGVRCLSRYTLNSWKMLAGDLPMPPSVTAPGRVQCVVGPDVDEAQTPLMDLEQARELVLASDMTPAPADMPGIAASVLSPSVLAGNVPALVGSDQGTLVQESALPPARPPGSMTLREAVEAGWWPTIGAARQARQRHRPQVVGSEGTADLYQISDLAKCKEDRRKR